MNSWQPLHESPISIVPDRRSSCGIGVMTIQRQSRLGLRRVNMLNRSSTALSTAGVGHHGEVVKARCRLNSIGDIRLRTCLAADWDTT